MVNIIGKKKDYIIIKKNDDLCHIKFNTLAIAEIKERIQQGDFVLCFWGKGHYHVGSYFMKDSRAIVVEPGVGYGLDQTFCDYKIFESYATMHQYIGKIDTYQPSWYNTVIPLTCDASQFTVSDTKEDYFLHLGRITKCKGLDIAIRACNHLGVKLKVAGTPKGDLEKLGVTITDNIEYIGLAGVEERRELMSKAKGFFCISTYAEPFGAAVVEAMLSGCPVITSDWGGFTETVVHGYTGFRIKNFNDVICAMKNIDNIDPHICRKWAENNYGMKKIASMIEEYFYNLKLNLSYEWKWWTIDCYKENLDYLKKDYSMLSVLKK
tara:strand:- start:1033 stop:2001 length:969 start_codon:yes stop_codon:yes gene_type:complete